MLSDALVMKAALDGIMCFLSSNGSVRMNDVWTDDNSPVTSRLREVTGKSRQSIYNTHEEEAVSGQRPNLGFQRATSRNAPSRSPSTLARCWVGIETTGTRPERAQVQNLALLTFDSGSIPCRPAKDSALSLAPYLPCCAICYRRVTSQRQITHSRLQRVSGTQYLLPLAPQDVVFSKNNGIYCRSTHASFHPSIT
ncbi:hypothetical protein Moror_10089, partial [Moniliophthora roreri MCA 2997]